MDNNYYNQNYYNQYEEHDMREYPMTLGDWMITLLILAIPVVNIVMAFVWGFGGNAPKSKQNFCRAVLIYYAIAFAFSMLFGFGFVSLFTNDFSTMYNL